MQMTAAEFDRIKNIYDNIYSTRANTPERSAKIASMSGKQIDELYNFSIKYRANDIQVLGGNSDMSNFMTYSQYKAKTNDFKSMQEVSDFAKEHPDIYDRHRTNLMQEREEENRRQNHVWRLMGGIIL